MTRVIAVDWSGAADERFSAEKIWLADVVNGELVALANGFTREETIAHLLEIGAETPDVVVGFDFSFSVPERFLVDKLGLQNASQLWRNLAGGSYTWLEPDPEGDFFGRVKGQAASAFAKANAYRTTELRLRDLKTRKLQPKSIFQIGGAGAVGTGAIRGMEQLPRLTEAGFNVWPFENQIHDQPTAIEIYPRFFTEETANTSPAARRSFVDRRFPELDGFARSLVVSSEDAFDAGVSALSMAKYSDELRTLPSVVNTTLRREGIIWTPSWADLLPEWNRSQVH